jgi:hypoxanthine-guanine phosphoribosyltransferase
VLRRLEKHLKRNLPKDIRIATLYQKPSMNQTDIKPDYCLYETNDWLVFPYELAGLSVDEIAQYKPHVSPLLQHNLLK